MSVPPVITTAISATIKWLWSAYGQTPIKKLNDKDSWNPAEWQHAATTYLTTLYRQAKWIPAPGKPPGQSLSHIPAVVNILDKPTTYQWYDIHQLKTEEQPNHFQQEKKDRDGLEIVYQHSKLFILGKPGSGKTTFLKYLTLKAIEGNLDERIPIFITLPQLAASGKSIIDFIVDQFRLCGFPETEVLVEQLLRDGKSILLFDGLDEVTLAHPQQASFIKTLKDFVHKFNLNHVVITCRESIMNHTFDEFEYVEMVGFGNIEIKNFIWNWFSSEKLQEKRHTCWQALKNTEDETLRELARVPLFLVLLCLIYEERDNFVAGKEIYWEATRALLSRPPASPAGKQDMPGSHFTLPHKQGLLALIAMRLSEARSYFIEKSELLRLITDYLAENDLKMESSTVLDMMQTGYSLLIEQPENVYAFYHPTLQLYYTAKYIVDNQSKALFDHIMPYVGDDQWRHIFLLTARMMEDGTDFYNAFTTNLDNLVAQDTTLLEILTWAERKASRVRTVYRTIAVRSFYIFLFLDHAHDSPTASVLARAFAGNLDRFLVRVGNLDSTRSLDRFLARVGDLDSALASASALDSVGALAHARAQALERFLNRTLTLDYALDHALDSIRTLDTTRSLDFASALDRSRARVRARALTQTIKRARARSFDLALDSALAFDSALVLASDLTRALTWARASARDLAHARFLDLDLDSARALDSALDRALHSALESIMQRLLASSQQLNYLELHETLKKLTIPTDVDIPEDIFNFHQELGQITLAHRDIGHDWDLTADQLKRLEAYFKANLLLIKCLQRANISEQARTEIENRLLLPVAQPTAEEGE